MMDILNLGCGNKLVQAGADDCVVNHDRVKHRPEIHIAADLNDLPWPWSDNSFDLIVACAVLEHLDLSLLDSANECWRILRPRGVLHLKLPYCLHEESYTDPTHRWRFNLHSLDIFDPQTKFGIQYGFYTDRKWQIIARPKLNKAGTSFSAKMQVLK